MTIKQLFELTKNAKDCGINTLGELLEYKRSKGLKTNYQLSRELFFDATECRMRLYEIRRNERNVV